MPPESEHDVFLCHKSQDKPEVKRVAAQLKAYGIRPWLECGEGTDGQLARGRTYFARSGRFSGLFTSYICRAFA